MCELKIYLKNKQTKTNRSQEYQHFITNSFTLQKTFTVARCCSKTVCVQDTLCTSAVTSIFTWKYIKKQFVQDYYSCKLLIISPTNPRTKAGTAVVTVY